MEIITNEIFRALGYLLITVFVMFAYGQARDHSKDGRLKEVLIKGFLWCGAIALFASLALGGSSCEEYDYPRGGCIEHRDDSFEPTPKERIAQFAYVMTLFFIPVVAGAFQGKDKKDDGLVDLKYKS